MLTAARRSPQPAARSRAAAQASVRAFALGFFYWSFPYLAFYGLELH